MIQRIADMINRRSVVVGIYTANLSMSPLYVPLRFSAAIPPQYIRLANYGNVVSTRS